MCLLTCTLFAMDLEPQKEIFDNPYSNGRPKTEYSFTLDASENKDSILFMSDSDRMALVTHYITDLFLNKKFQQLQLPFYPPDWNFRRIYTFGRVISNKLKEVVVIDIQNHSKKDTPFLGYQECQVWQRTKEVQSWHLNIKTPNSEVIKATEMSWRFVDTVIHHQEEHVDNYRLFPSFQLRERLYRRIKKNGLEKSVIRLGIVADKEGMIHFSALYDTDEEKQQNLLFLEKFMQEIMGN